MHFTTTADPGDGSIVLQPHGELDLVTAPLLRDTIAMVVRAKVTASITLELTHLTFMDGAGARAVRQSQVLAAMEGVPLVVTNAPPLTAMVLFTCEGVQCSSDPTTVARPTVDLHMSW